MFFPLKTEAHDGRFRLGALGIIGICILVHVLVWRDNAAREDRVSGLVSRVERDQADKKIEDMMKDVGGKDLFDEGAPPKAHDPEAAEDGDAAGSGAEVAETAPTPAAEPGPSAVEALQKEREASLFYRLALVKGDFNPLNLITNLFTHADLSHILFNLWFFYLVGVTMEKYWGTGKFIALYLGIGVFANLAFMLIAGAKSRGVPLVGASGAIAGMMGAFAATHGDAKVTMMWMFGFRMNTFQVSARIYLGFWIVGQLWDGFVHSGQAGGVAFSAHIAGFAAGFLLGKKVPGDAFYERAYAQDGFAKAVDDIVSGEKLEVRAAPKADLPPQHQGGGDVMTLLNQARHALEQGNGQAGGQLLFQALEKAFAIPGLDPRVFETALMRVMESLPYATLPGGVLYAWARRLESIDWWQWAIRFYDAAAHDPSSGTNAHARSNARFRAAVIRMDRLYEKDQARKGFQDILALEPEGSFAEEAGQRLAAMGSR
jgi:membrane associated rhomboid family serine protease